MSDLNLLPSRAKFQALKIGWQKKINWFVRIILTCWLLLAIVIFGWWWINLTRLSNLEKKYKLVLSQYQSMSESAVASEFLKHQAKVVSQILEQRFEYGQALIRANQLLPQGSILANFDLREDNKFVLSGVTLKGEDVDQIEATLERINLGQNEGFSQGRLTSLVWENDGWNFELEVKAR